MRNIAVAMLVTALGYGVAAAQPAEQTGMETKKEMKVEKKAKQHVCKGRIEAVDAVAGTITVKTTEGKNEGKKMVMPIGADTKLTRKGKPVLLSDIMVGEKVQIKYEGEMDNPTVKYVKVEMTHKQKEMIEDKAEKKAKQEKEEIDK